MDAYLPPEDMLWLSILEQTPELENKSEDEIRQYLKEGGFPENLVVAFLESRRKHLTLHPPL